MRIIRLLCKSVHYGNILLKAKVCLMRFKLSLKLNDCKYGHGCVVTMPFLYCKSIEILELFLWGITSCLILILTILGTQNVN